MPLPLGVVADLESVTGMGVGVDLPVLVELVGMGRVDGGVGKYDSSRLRGMMVVFNCG